jgi:hypothetical protein
VCVGGLTDWLSGLLKNLLPRRGRISSMAHRIDSLGRQHRQAQLDGRRGVRARLLLGPRRDVKRLHGHDRRHQVIVAPHKKVRHGAAVDPARVRIADVRREEFQKAKWTRGRRRRR